MTLTTSHKDAMELRRERVAQLRLRGLTVREITAALAKQEPPIVNPSSGEPYTHVTILNDLDVLKDQWKASASAGTAEHMARQLAELWEIKRAAWGAKDPELALKALDREMKLTGTVTSGLTINFNVTLVNQVVEAIMQAGLEPSEVFNNLLAELANAERTDVST